MFPVSLTPSPSRHDFPPAVQTNALYHQANPQMRYSIGYYQIRGKNDINVEKFIKRVNDLIFKTQNLNLQQVRVFQEYRSSKMQFCYSVTQGGLCSPDFCHYSHSVEEKYAYNFFFDPAYKGSICHEMFERCVCRFGINCSNVHPGELMIHVEADGRLNLCEEAQRRLQMITPPVTPPVAVTPPVESPLEQKRSWNPWEGKEIVCQAARDLIAKPNLIVKCDLRPAKLDLPVESAQEQVEEKHSWSPWDSPINCEWLKEGAVVLESKEASAALGFAHAFLEPIKDTPPQTPRTSPWDVDRANGKRSPFRDGVLSFSPLSLGPIVEVEEPAYSPRDQTQVAKVKLPSSTRSPAFQIRRTLSLESIVE